MQHSGIQQSAGDLRPGWIGAIRHCCWPLAGEQLYHVWPRNGVNCALQPDNLALQCSSKLGVSLAVQNAGSLATQALQFSIPCVNRHCPRLLQWEYSSAWLQHTLAIRVCCCSGSGGCPCTCDFATDVGCQCRDLAETINITVTEGPVYGTYPLTYQQAYNWQPTEVPPPHAATTCCNRR